MCVFNLLQNILMDFKSIRSSKAFQLVNDRLQKSQAELDHYQTLLEKLQVVTGQWICWIPELYSKNVSLEHLIFC